MLHKSSETSVSQPLHVSEFVLLRRHFLSPELSVSSMHNQDIHDVVAHQARLNVIIARRPLIFTSFRNTTSTAHDAAHFFFPGTLVLLQDDRSH